MAKTLRVIDPFFVMDFGDTFEWDENAKMYVSKHKEEFYKNEDSNVNEIKSSYNSEFQISKEYAASLIKEGFLEEAAELEKQSTFVNIFDEIDTLIDKYTNNLATLDKDTAELPACIRVEKEAVLTNLLTLLKHLKGLKK